MWAVKALNKVGSSVRAGLETAATSVNDALSAPESSTEASEAAIYKSMVVDLQFDQVKTSREYQKLFADQERKIQRLEVLLSRHDIASVIDSNDDGTSGSPSVADPSSLPASALSTQSTAAPKAKTPVRKRIASMTREDDDDDAGSEILEMRSLVKEFEDRLRSSLREKVEAEGEARVLKSTLDGLSSQMRALKSHLREQDTKLKRYGSLHEVLKERREGDEHAMDSLALEYSKLSAEAEAQNQTIADLERSKKRMETKIAEQETTIQLLVAGTNEGGVKDGPRTHTDSPKPHDGVITSPAKLVADMRAATSAASAAEANSKSLEAELTSTRKRVVELAASLADAKASLAGSENEKRRRSSSTEEDSAAKRELESLLAETKTCLETTKAELDALRSDSATQLEQIQSADEKIAQLEQAAVQAEREMKEEADAHAKASDSMLGEWRAKVEAVQSEGDARLQSSAKKLEDARARSAEQVAKLERSATEIATLQARAQNAEAKANQLGLAADQAAVQSAKERKEEADAHANALKSMVEEWESKLASQAEEMKADSDKAIDAINAEMRGKLDECRASAANAQKEASAALEASKEALGASEALLVKEKADRAQDAKEHAKELATSIARIETEWASKIECAKAELNGLHAAAVATMAQNHKAALDEAHRERDAAADALAVMREAHEADLLSQKETLEAEANDRVEALRATMTERHAAEIEAVKTDAAKQISVFEERYAKEAKLRRKVHNALMDLKGNIRVFCRVRPKLEYEFKRKDDSGASAVVFPFPNEIAAFRDVDSPQHFEYDAVYKQDSTQEEVFQEVSELCTSVLDGFNVCIFAYGQTGSGKTYTMEGPPSNRGVNFRALERLFFVSESRAPSWEYSFNVNVLEIYNETVRDLLTPTTKKSREALDIRLKQGGGVYVEGALSVDVASMDDVNAAMKRANSNRAVGAHDLNEHSSRSHLVFTISVTGSNAATGVNVSGKLSLIDLAGSERLGKTGATGDRLKEAKNINKSLSALGDVISALANKKKGGSSHVPFRNSKLTYLLQDSLGGRSKVAMFVNISPVAYNVSETLCSLNFAQRCRKVELGQAKKNSKSNDIAHLKRVIDDLREQLKRK